MCVRVCVHRQLRKWHDSLKDKVITLMGTDLVRSKDRWAAGVKDMRDVFARLEAEGYTRESQQVGVGPRLCVFVCMHACMHVCVLRGQSRAPDYIDNPWSMRAQCSGL